MATLINFLEDHLLTCSIKNLTGFNCPGCGMQRAFIALLRGDLEGSFQSHPALLPLLFTLVLITLHLRFEFPSGHRYIVASFVVTVSLMIVNFVVKSFPPL